jgi:Na+-driven multidrug efflux pump
VPINIALLFCIPIGILYYFAARGLIRFFLGRYEQKERRAACLFGAFGTLSIPLIFCSRLVGDAISGRFGRAVADGLFAVVALGLIGPLLKTLMEGKWRSFGSNH